MLSVSPPLHQDFRGAHTRFCSPGDGWPAFIPPPIPTVQPAFHFCSVLLDPEAYAPRYNPWLKKPKPKTPLDERLHGACAGALHLPSEILGQILQYAIADGLTGPSLIKSSRHLRETALPHIYRNIRLKTPESVELFAQCLDAHPERAELVRQLHIETHRVNWDTMARIARHLSRDELVEKNEQGEYCPQAERVESLSIGIQASDLSLASEFLASFSPSSFTWHTSPCWLMRPANLYCAFLSKWPRLEEITLEGFRFDEVLAECLRVVPSLRKVTLAGKGCQHLDARSLRALLCPDPLGSVSPASLSSSLPSLSTSLSSNASRTFSERSLSPPSSTIGMAAPYQIIVADCPQDRREVLMAELDHLDGSEHDFITCSHTTLFQHSRPGSLITWI